MSTDIGSRQQLDAQAQAHQLAEAQEAARARQREDDQRKQVTITPAQQLQATGAAAPHGKTPDEQGVGGISANKEASRLADSAQKFQAFAAQSSPSTQQTQSSPVTQAQEIQRVAAYQRQQDRAIKG